MFKLFDFNDDNVLCYDELKMLVQTVAGALAILQGRPADYSNLDTVTERLYKGNSRRAGDEMTFEEFAVSIEAAGYKSGLVTAPDETIEHVPVGLFQRFYVKAQQSPLRAAIPTVRFSSLNCTPIRPSISTLRLPPLQRVISDKAISLTKRVFVVLSTQKQQQYTPLDIRRFKERFDRLAAEHKGQLRVSGNGEIDILGAFDGVLREETQARLLKLATDDYSRITFEQFLQLLVPQASRAQVLKMASWAPKQPQSVFPRRLKAKLMSVYEVTNYRRVFDKKDTNTDGRLELWELKEALKSLRLEGEPRWNASELDAKYSNGIDFRGFLYLVKEPHILIPQDLDM